LNLSDVDQVFPEVKVEDLPRFYRQQVEKGIVADDKPAAEGIVDRLSDRSCRQQATPGATPTTGPTPADGPTQAPSPGATTFAPPVTATSPSAGTGQEAETCDAELG
jgi:hypothetical protein